MALGTLKSLEEQKFFVSADQLGYLHKLARDVTKGPGRIPARVVARLKGVITFLWVAVGNATRVPTRAKDRVIEQRRPASSFSRQDRVLERVDQSIASLSRGDPAVAAEAEVPAERRNLSTSTAGPSAPARSQRESTTMCLLMPTTREQELSFLWRGRRRPLRPLSGPCAGWPHRACQQTSL